MTGATFFKLYEKASISMLAATMCTVDLMAMHSYAFAASTMQGYFRDVRSVKKQNRFFGGVLMGVGTALFFVKRGA